MRVDLGQSEKQLLENQAVYDGREPIIKDGTNICWDGKRLFLIHATGNGDDG